MATMSEVYGRLRAQLQEQWVTGEVAAHFAPGATLPSMFRHLWARPEAQQVLVPPPPDARICRKGAPEAERFRSEGNRLYRERKLEQALAAYTYSVLTAPHPALGAPPGPPHLALALALANRSAVLFEMGQFEAALADAGRALGLGYPGAKGHRLQERRARCLVALGRGEEAGALLDQALAALPALSLAREDLAAATASLTKLRARGAAPPPPPAHLYHWVFYRGLPRPPPVSRPRQDLPCLSDAIAVRYSPTRGRHLVAQREVLPGEVLVVEEPLAAVLKLDSTLRCYCSTCLRRCPAPLPCPSCSLVVFCDEECQKRGVLGAHGAECAILSTLVTLQLDHAAALAFRVLSSTTLASLRTAVAALQQEGAASWSSTELSRDYRALYNLQSHATARTESQLQETAATACVLTHLLLERCPSFLKDESGNPISVTEEDVVLVGGQVMRLILGIECNAHVTKEAEGGMADNEQSEARSPSAERGREVGWSVYSALSLINHSCIPNALSTSHGSTKFLYSISVIPSGAEVTESYGERYVSHDRATRRQALQDQYYFCCSCVACQADWPLFLSLPRKPNLRCPSCSQALHGFTCGLCELACTVKRTTEAGVNLYDASNVQVQINRAWNCYVKAAMKVDSGKVSADIVAAVVAVVELLDRYSVQPNQAYIAAQETLMKCYDLMGSVYLLPGSTLQ